MSAHKSGTQDLSGASNAQNTKAYNTRSNPKGLDNKNNSFDGYSSATSKKQQRKTKAPVVPNNRRIAAAEQEYINKTQPQVTVTPVPPFTPMDMGLEDRLNYQAAQSAQMDTSQLQGLDTPKFGKSPDDIFADMQKRAEIQAVARDLLKKNQL